MPCPRAISLFSNCGAGDLGYRESGFRFNFVAELDPCRLEVCLLNHPEAIGIPGDLRETWPKLVKIYRRNFGDTRPSLLAACPPCQGLSSAKSNRGRSEDADAGSKDERNLLVVVIAKVAQELRPDIIVVENVPAFLIRKVRKPSTNEPISAANLVISLLNSDYEVFPMLADLSDYGIPQTRKRAFLTFIRKKVKGLDQLLSEHRAPYPRPTYAYDYCGPGPIKLRLALQSFQLPSLDARSQETATTSVGDVLHSVPVWSDFQYAMVSAIPPNSGASAWENDVCKDCGFVDVGKDDAVCPLCGESLLRPVVKEKDGTFRLIKGFRTSSYRRMYPEKPASTVTTASGHIGSDFTIHPFENRLLSPLECAYLQTFPSDFKWGEALEKWGQTNIRRMIGEAVPPLFTYQHGKVLLGVLTGRWSRATISLSDQRCASAARKLGLSRL